MNDKVYVVTDGEYSDFRIEGIFTEKDKAEKYADTFGYDNIEEWDLNPDFKIENNIWMVYVYLDGSEPEVERKSYLMGKCENLGIRNAFRYQDNYMCSGSSVYTFIIESDSVKKAIKIATDRTAFIKAYYYLFPKLRYKCAKDEYGHDDYPWYDFKTKHIIDTVGGNSI